jgi:glycosyltransferase involved in cell wall biosynthesis
MSKSGNHFNVRRAFRSEGREIVVNGSERAFEAQVLIGVTLHNQALALRECLASVCAQRNVPLPFAVLVLDDDSKDDWQTSLGNSASHIDLAFAQARCGSAAHARNCLLDLVDAMFPKARWVARLDADDRFASPDSLSAAVRLAMSSNARFILGGNRLRYDGELLDRTNPATPDLLRADYVLSRLARMAGGEPEAELPSCNLLLATHAGWRYPWQSSAEDHWLVTELLIRHAREGAILTEPFYADYSLKGTLTLHNHRHTRYLSARRALLRVAESWAGKSAAVMLGSGREGVVTLENGQVCKRFYDGAITDQHVEWLERALRNVMPHLPEPVWQKEDGAWTLRYPWFETEPVESFDLAELREFFVFCLRKNLVCVNVNHANFRRRPQGGLTYVDISKYVLPMNVDYFRDACARGFVLAELGWTDDELRRRSKELRDEAMLRSLPGFAEFYSSILHEHARQQLAAGVIPAWPVASKVESNVTLLIKACAMDAATLAIQVRHIVGQLEHPRRFAERVLVLDPFRGPFLRQHCDGDWPRLLEESEQLSKAGWLDRVLVAPDDPQTTTALNERWFNVASPHTHCVRGIPVTPQLWGFEQVRTRYVLQCDVDALIGRRDLGHDYLADMLQAVSKTGVLGVAFNIPHAPDSGFRDFDALPGEFVPEVRCGLLDLERIFACRPLPNSLTDGRLTLTWYRALQRHQQAHGMRTLRGGDPRTFFVHPPNTWKQDDETLDRVRDLVAQGRVPSTQFEKWDLSAPSGDWTYESRHESIVFVVKGRNTAPAKIERCLRSLAMQDDQGFGLVLVDDGSDSGNAPLLPHLLRPFAGRCTLVCRSRRHGYMPNTLLAIRDIISSPDALAVVLDLDDALLHCSVVTRLKEAAKGGADVVLAAMFRPDKPLKLYHPDFVEPRAKWGGEVWIHLRSFRKRLLDALPDEDLQLDGDWIDDCEDYATMIPLVEMAQSPVYLPEYLYFHERSKPTTPELRQVRHAIIRRILAKPSRRLPASELK